MGKEDVREQLRHALNRPVVMLKTFDPERYAEELEKWKRDVGWRRIFRGGGKVGSL